jgi:hypothetical protein
MFAGAVGAVAQGRGVGLQAAPPVFVNPRLTVEFDSYATDSGVRGDGCGTTDVAGPYVTGTVPK